MTGAQASPGRIPALVLILALVAPLLNAIPTLDGYLQEEHPGRIFLGFRHMAGDHFQYGSLVRQVSQEGRFFLEDRYTTEAQSGRWVFLYFWLLGVIMRFTGLGFPVVWEVMRLLAGFLFMLALWRLTGLLFRERGHRILAYVVAGFSGGIGWLALMLPGDFLHRPGFPGLTDPVNYQWNWSTFCSMLIPMWIAAELLLLTAAHLFGREKPLGPPWRWAAGLILGPAIWFIHPHSGNVAYLTIGLFALAPLFASLWRLEAPPWGDLRRSILYSLPFLLSFSLVAWYVRWAGGDPVFAEVTRQAVNWNPTYSIFLYPLTYGLLVPFALLGMRWSGSIPERPRRIILAWLAGSVLLSVNPLWAGAKHQYLVHLPLALLATHGFLEARERSPWVRSLSRGIPAVLLAALVFLNAPISILKDFPKTASQADAYRHAADLEAMRFLAGQPAGAVLCDGRSGAVIAWLGDKKVFQGHWLLTLDSRTKRREMAAFFSPRVPSADKRAFLGQRGIRYVFMGTTERSFGELDPALGLERIYDKDGVSIHRVP